MRLLPKPVQNAGFTLIELMVTILIATTLLTIAVPTYQTQIRKSRRTEARTTVLDLATREERYYSLNNSYSNNDVDLGYGNANAQIQNLVVGSGYYKVTVTVTAANPAATPPTRAAFQVVATATGTQAKDTSCQTFTVDQTGTQTSAPTTTCWN
jgi:type IV pilus assembly protein PilE